MMGGTMGPFGCSLPTPGRPPRAHAHARVLARASTRSSTRREHGASGEQAARLGTGAWLLPVSARAARAALPG